MLRSASPYKVFIIATTTQSKSWKKVVQEAHPHCQSLSRDAGQPSTHARDLVVLPKGAHATASGSVRKSPWYHNDRYCKTIVTILKSDLTLPKHNANIVEGFLCLDDTDYTPVELGWGFCLLGFFCRKIP